jgi:2-polyprenyl-6-methoxyphenol hydroxylase-like FAD-dependent oxidoreductase
LIVSPSTTNVLYSGQGMNTGIGDAINLAWKLAAESRKKSFPCRHK